MLEMRSATLASRVGRNICSVSIASDSSAPAPMAIATLRGGRQRGDEPDEESERHVGGDS